MSSQAAKISFLLSVFLTCSIASAQGKYRPGQYPVNQNPDAYTIRVHIYATHFRPCGSAELATDCAVGIHADAILDGKKVELSGGADKHQAHFIATGDYRAMLVKKPRADGREILFQRYYLLLPDRTAWLCEITGFSE